MPKNQEKETKNKTRESQTNYTTPKNQHITRNFVVEREVVKAGLGRGKTFWLIESWSNENESLIKWKRMSPGISISTIGLNNIDPQTNPALKDWVN